MDMFEQWLLDQACEAYEDGALSAGEVLEKAAQRWRDAEELRQKGPT